jgi:hypothetical protein
MSVKPAFIVRAVCLTLLLPLLLTNRAAHAECECLWQGSFVEVQAETALVVGVTVLSGKGNSIDLKVDTLLRGTSSSEIRVWLKAENYCRPEPALFPADSRWVMALHRIDSVSPGGFNPSTPNISFGRPGDYALSSCGGYWLSLTENWVSGNLINAPRWARKPKMTPVLLELLSAYVAGEVEASVLLEASREDPALRKLMLDTKAFLRQ